MTVYKTLLTQLSMSMVYLIPAFIRTSYWWGGGLAFEIKKKNTYAIVLGEKSFFEIAVSRQMLCSYMTMQG